MYDHHPVTRQEWNEYEKLMVSNLEETVGMLSAAFRYGERSPLAEDVILGLTRTLEKHSSNREYFLNKNLEKLLELDRGVGSPHGYEGVQINGDINPTELSLSGEMPDRDANGNYGEQTIVDSGSLEPEYHTLKAEIKRLSEEKGVIDSLKTRLDAIYREIGGKERQPRYKSGRPKEITDEIIKREEDPQMRALLLAKRERDNRMSIKVFNKYRKGIDRFAQAAERYIR